MRTLIVAALTVLAGCDGVQGAPFKGNAALAFDGDGCLTVTTEPVPALTALTIEAWVRAPLPDDAFPPRMPLVTVGTLAELWLADDGTGLSQPGSADNLGYKSTAVLFDEQTHHLVASWTPTGSNMYIDGIRRGQGIPWEAFPAVDTVWIGCNESGSRMSTLQVDEVRISTDLRYPTNFEVPTEPFTVDDQTMGLWHLDRGRGTRVDDATERFKGEFDVAEWVEGLVGTVASAPE